MKTTNILLVSAISSIAIMTSAFAANEPMPIDHEAHHPTGGSGMTMSGIMMPRMMNADHMEKMKDMMIDMHKNMLKPWLRADLTEAEKLTLISLLTQEASMANMMKESSQEDQDKLLSLIDPAKREAFKIMKESMKEMKKNMPTMMEKMKDCMKMM